MLCAGLASSRRFFELSGVQQSLDSSGDAVAGEGAGAAHVQQAIARRAILWELADGEVKAAAAIIGCVTGSCRAV